MYKRYLLVHPEWGVYLGSMWSLGFWSKLDPVGQNSAAVFENWQEIHDFVDTWESKPKEYDIEEITTEDPNYATISEISKLEYVEVWTP